MVILRSYVVAVVFCVITMLCWGSWANTQKLAGETWRFELFYWDYVFGVMLMALIFALTMGSAGRSGRNFLADLRQANRGNIGSALLGGRYASSDIFKSCGLPRGSYPIYSSAISLCSM